MTFDMFWSNFHFLRPLWLAAAIPAVIFFVALRSARLRANGWGRIINSSLLPHLLDGEQGQQGNRLLYLLLSAWLLTCISLAGPAWEKLPQPVQKKEDALVLVQDMSLSLYANDLSPNRLVRAQHKLEDILEHRREGITGLIVYAGDAHVVSPLTDDTATIAGMIPSLSPGIMPLYGSDAAKAVSLAIDLLKDAGISSGRVLLLTDEVMPDDARKVTDELRGKNIELLVLGIGTPEGGPIPKSDGSFLKDDAGNIIVPRLNRVELRNLAAENGGRYRDITLDDRDIDFLLAASTLRPDIDNYRQLDRKFDQWREAGPWLLLLVLPAALFAFRKGYLLVCLLTLALWSGECHAFTWQDLWQTKDQQAASALEQNDPAKAAELFRKPAWKGVAQYRAGDFSDAVTAFGREDTAESLYNLGNALAKAGKYQDALQAYDRSLKLNPDMEDARFNRKLIEQVLQKQKQEQQVKDNQQKQGNQGQQQKNQQNQAGQGQQQKGDNQNQQKQQNHQAGQDKQNSQTQKQGNQGQQQEDRKNQTGQGKQADDGKQQAQAQNQKNAAKQQNSGGQEAQPPEKNGGLEEKTGTPEQKQPNSSAEDAKKKTAEKDDQSRQQGKMDAGKAGKENPDDQLKGGTVQAVEGKLSDEEKQEIEQWLRQVPDNPGGLLRRKFEYESRRNREKQRPREDKKIW